MVWEASIFLTTSLPLMTLPKTAYPTPSLALSKSRNRLLPVLMKNCAVAESGYALRAMAMADGALRRPFFASFAMGEGGLP